MNSYQRLKEKNEKLKVEVIGLRANMKELLRLSQRLYSAKLEFITFKERLKKEK